MIDKTSRIINKRIIYDKHVDDSFCLRRKK
nr:MAG TPA: hypothetical protein [Caudoviricetes sp.]